MFLNAGGLQLMGWLTGSEIYPLAVREADTSVQSAVLWNTNLLITLTLPTMIEGIGVGPTMWVYAAFNVFTFVFVLLRTPELTAAASSSRGRAAQGTLPPGRLRAAHGQAGRLNATRCGAPATGREPATSGVKAAPTLTTQDAGRRTPQEHTGAGDPALSARIAT